MPGNRYLYAIIKEVYQKSTQNIYSIMQRSVKQVFRIFQGLAKKGRNGYRCNGTSEQEHQKRQILLVRVKER